jgi:hypothetical protein
MRKHQSVIEWPSHIFSVTPERFFMEKLFLFPDAIENNFPFNPKRKVSDR